MIWREVRPAGIGPRRPVPDDDAWIIFTSGTTGTPKGVAVTHRKAAAFVDAEADLFLRGDPLGPGDRVLAGLSVAFDASCEEMWLAWRHGACLVPAPRSVVRTGPDLVTWLAQRRVGVVSTVPTLAALWPTGPPPGIRLLVLGGEVCPGGLADKLARPGIEVWNAYGPTEATVVSCAARLSGGGPVRIGLPLDGWRLAVVDPETGHPVRWGEAGELVIDGVGVARYLDADRDAVDFRPLEALGWERAYHTGDLVRADPEGLMYLGRADAQVKIRGYRIEPSEIEAVLMQLPGIALAAVTTYEPQPGVVELVGCYTLQDQAAVLDRQAAYEYLRNHLPRHMVPAYLEELPAMPLLPDGKADRTHLPEPTSSGRLVADQAYIAPAKNRHNVGTMGLFLGVRWVHALVITLFAMAAWELYRGHGILVLAGLMVATLLFSLAYFITVERALMGFRSLRPRYCSIYDPYFWWHERYWKLLAPLLGMFNGTPFKSPAWRLVGVRIGRRVFDDGCAIPERTLVTIGDHCTLNARSVIQCHSMEDGIFKADYTVLEDGCTLGTEALVHYGVTIGQGAQLRPDSFLMKGEKVPPHARWGGNPARAM